jgi:hypothetical protein
MAKEPKQLDALFHEALKDIYFAEKKILSALPKMAKAAQHEDFRLRSIKADPEGPLSLHQTASSVDALEHNALVLQGPPLLAIHVTMRVAWTDILLPRLSSKEYPRMKDHVTALAEAVRLARLEIACYYGKDCRGTAESAIKRLHGLLNNRQIDEAMAVLSPDEVSPSIVPEVQKHRATKHHH